VAGVAQKAEAVGARGLWLLQNEGHQDRDRGSAGQEAGVKAGPADRQQDRELRGTMRNI